jgi:hypothetical protein
MCISDEDGEKDREYLSDFVARNVFREKSSRTRTKEEKKRKKEKNYNGSLKSLASAVVESTHVSINADYYYLGTVTYRLFLKDSLYRFTLNQRSGLTPSPPLASKASFNSNGNASVH